MSALIDKIFPESQAKALRKLWEDKTCHLLIQKEIGKKLLEKDIIEEFPLAQIIVLTSLSPFAKSEEECVDVAHIIYWGILRTDILPMITEVQKEEELAYKCLISLGLFKKVLIKKYEVHGAPSPKFYRMVGITSFRHIGKDDISDHFCQWEGFMGEMFV